VQLQEAFDAECAALASALEAGGEATDHQVCQSSVHSVLAAARDGAVLVGLRETRTTSFRASEMRTVTPQDTEWSHGPSTE